MTDADNQPVIATVVVAGDASAAMGDFTNASAWTRTVSGSDLVYTQTFAARPNVGSVVQAALQALTFAPARLDPGATQSVAFSASITPVGGATTQVANTSLAVTGALRPYLDLSVADTNPKAVIYVLDPVA